MLLRETFAVGPFASNCTVLACADTKEAVIIDPGGGVSAVRQAVEKYSLTVKGILLTHAHLDHCYAIAEVKEAHGGTVYLHASDQAIYQSSPAQALMFGLRPHRTVPIDNEISDGDVIHFGKKAATVVHTPGHTPGSVCFAIEDDGMKIAFSGDTLFCRGVGRTDLPGGDTRQLIESIRTRLYTMDPKTLVIPGHGENTTIAEEAAENPFVTR